MGGVYDEIHPSGSGSGPAARHGSAYANVIGSYEDVDLAFEVRTPHALLNFATGECNIYVIADIENAVATQSIHILGSPASKPATSYEQGLKRVSDD